MFIGELSTIILDQAMMTRMHMVSKSFNRLPLFSNQNFKIPNVITILSFIISDMRKALSRDKLKKSIIPLPHPVRPEDLD